jgi:hypothetical protein
MTKQKKKPKKQKVTKLEYAGDVLDKKKPQKPKGKPKKGNYAKNESFPALNPRRQVYARRWHIDGDYYDKLNSEEKAWMNSFLSETIVTNFYHAGPEIYTEVEDKRALYRENNSRNKDLVNYGRSKLLEARMDEAYSAAEAEMMQDPDSIEDYYLKIIELKRSNPDLDFDDET